MNLAGFISLLSAGEEIGGSQLATPGAVAFANLHFPSRAYCLVAEWAILDLDVTTPQRKAITDRGLIPAPVYALIVIRDSKGRFQRGDWVRQRLGFPSPTPAYLRRKIRFMCLWEPAVGCAQI